VKAVTASLSSNRAEAVSRLLFLLLLFLLPTQLGKHFWPEYSLVSGFRVDYLSPTIYTTDILICLLVLLSLFRLRHHSPTRVFTAILPYVLVLFFLFLTILPAESCSAGGYSLLEVAELLFFGWYTSALLASPALLALSTRVIAITVLGESVLALLQVSARGSLGGMLYWVGERTITALTPGAATTVLGGEVVLRPYATFPHPNVLAGFLLLGLTWILLRPQDFSTRPARSAAAAAGQMRRLSPIAFLRVGSLLLGSLGLFSTLSRIPILLWGVVLFGYGCFQLRQRLQTRRSLPLSRKPWSLTAILLGVLALGFLLLPLLTLMAERFAGSSLNEESFLVRWDLTQIAWQLIRAHPLLGVGLGNFLLNSAPLRAPETPLFLAVQPVHNLFLLILAETGVLGLFLWCWFLIRSFRAAFISTRIVLGLLLLLGLFDHYFLTLQQGQLLLAFFLGLCWTGRARRLSDYSPELHT
jgi:O-antigen ligase